MLSLVKNLFARTKKARRSTARLHLEHLETRIVPVVTSLDWSPQSNNLASNGNNWENFATGTRGKGPLDLPGAQINFGRSSTAPITWDNPGPGQNEVYSLGTVTFSNAYSAQQTVNKTVSVEAGGLDVPLVEKLNLYFMGPSRDTVNGSFFYVAGANNTVTNMTLQGASGVRSGNFIIEQGASLTLGAGAFDILSMKNTEADVYGGLYLQPDSSGNYSSLDMEQASLLVAMSNGTANGTIVAKDAGFGSSGENIITNADRTQNLLWVYPQASLTFNVAAQNDALDVPILNNGLTSVYGDSTGTTLSVNGIVPSGYGNSYSIDNVALVNETDSGFFYLWDKVNLDVADGYYQGGTAANQAILQTDTSNFNTIFDVSGTTGLFFDQNSSVIFAASPVPFGILELLGNVTFYGTEQVLVSTTNNSCDQILVSGDLLFGGTSTIIASATGSSSQYTGPWKVFSCSGTMWNWDSVIVGPWRPYKRGNPGYITI